MVGDKHYRWTVISESNEKRNGRRLWLCQCECGTERLKLLTEIKHGLSKSCGCYNREQSSKKHAEHGKSKDPIYTVWKNMKKRCNYEGSCDYYLYGARGIKVCDRWLTFANFYEDMGDIPFPGAQIDRIDTNGDYTPENCRWTTATQNMRTRRMNHYITYQGETRCITEWEEIKGFPREKIRTRLKAGWTLEEAMETPVKKTGIAARPDFQYSDSQHKWAKNKSTGSARSVVL